MCRRLSLLVLLVFGPLAIRCPPVAASAQELAVGFPTSPEDSARLHRATRSRQATFERVRRSHLPWAWGGGSGECDERIGRFCLTYSDDDTGEWEPPEEHEAVVRERARLIQQLDDAAASIPGDRWVAGSRVRYLVEAGRDSEALAAAAACRAASWWCDSLLGYAAHHAGRSGEAHEAFSRALAAMPHETLREWTDLATILDSRTVRRYRRLAAAERTRFEERFWKLADPLLQTAGNEVRSAHLSRMLLVELQDRSKSPENIPWGSDLAEIMIRFGPPSGWERIRRPFQLHSQEVSLVSHYPESDIDLLPPPELLEEEYTPLGGIWDDDDRRARASYPLPRGPERVRWIQPFDHQAAVFRQPEGALLVVAYALPTDSLPPGAAVDAALTVLPGEDLEPLVAPRPGSDPAGVLTLQTPAAPLLVSLEAVLPEANRAARARFGLDVSPLVPGLLAASDLLILDLDQDTVPEIRAEAVRRARPSTRVRPGERIGIYWEVYSPGAPWPESLGVSVRLVDADAGWLRRLAERAGVVSRNEPVRLLWADAPGGNGTLARSLAFRVPEDAGAGRYTLELTLSAPGREPLVVRRSLEVGP